MGKAIVSDQEKPRRKPGAFPCWNNSVEAFKFGGIKKEEKKKKT